MQFEYQSFNQNPSQPRHRLVITTSTGEVIEGRTVYISRTPTITYADRRYAWLGGRVVSVDPIGRPCNGRGCTITLVGNTYCKDCAAMLQERKKKAEIHNQGEKVAKKVVPSSTLAEMIAALSPKERKEILESM